MASIRQVAKDAGVSIATVSRVINNSGPVGPKIRERVQASINRCGYVAQVGRRVTSYLALAYTGRSSFGEPFDATLCQGMAEAMAECEWDLVFLNLARDKKPTESYTQFFTRKGVRGVILRTTMRTRDVCREIADEGFAALVVSDHFTEPGMSYIYCDSYPSSRQGVSHLLDLGHRRIALAISELEDSDHADRLRAYQEALADRDIPLDEALIFRTPPTRPDGGQVIRAMMGMARPPTAIFIADPMVAVGAINEAHQLGVRVPADISVLAFDDADVRNHVYPRMTAICQDARQLGYEAFMLLARSLTNGLHTRPVQETLGTWLEINGTTQQPTDSPARVLPDGTRMQASST